MTETSLLPHFHTTGAEKRAGSVMTLLTKYMVNPISIALTFATKN